MQSLDPTPHESLRNSSYLKWADTSRAMQEAVEEIHLCHVRLHFDLYHGPQVKCSVPGYTKGGGAVMSVLPDHS